MQVLKCPVCGGEVKYIENKSIGECIFCGKRISIPTSVERKAGLYNRATELRQQYEFDSAVSVYENILSDEENEADAYWGIVLCRYGIEYVEDPRTSDMIPTCHRASYKSLLNDENYKKALYYADDEKRKLWTEEAERLDNLLKAVLAEASRQNQYEIFICYKENDGDGNRTEDSVIAHEIYNALEKEGYHVFFAPKSISYGSAYEPYIFSALHSSRLMFVIGTKTEYFEAPWVRNEWARFLELIQDGKEKTLIPLYKNMEPENGMPKELVRLQSYNLDTLGYIQDICDAAAKILGRKARQTAAPGATRTVSRKYVERAKEARKQGNAAEAQEYINKALQIDNTNPEAWWEKLGMLTSDFNIEYKEQLYTPEELECKNSALRYADDIQAETYSSVLEEYERGTNELVAAKYWNELDEAYEKEIRGFADRDYVSAIKPKQLEGAVESYRKTSEKILRFTNDDKKEEVQKLFSSLFRYRDVFNQLIMKYSTSIDRNDEMIRKSMELGKDLENIQKKLKNSKGIIFGLIMYAVAIFFGIMGCFADHNAKTAAVLVISVIMGIEITVNYLQELSIISKLFAIIGISIGLLVGDIVVAIYIERRSGHIRTEELQFEIQLAIALLLAVIFFVFRLIRWKKQKKYMASMEKLSADYNSNKAAMKDRADAALNRAEEECAAAKKYFLDRNAVYDLINRIS